MIVIDDYEIVDEIVDLEDCVESDDFLKHFKIETDGSISWTYKGYGE